MSKLDDVNSGSFFSDTIASSSSESSGGAQSYPALDLELLRIIWYHPNMNRNAAEHILIGTNKVGSYLLRNYSRGGPDDLTVSVKYPSDIKHFPVIWKGDGYLFGKHKFNNLGKLLEHFENIPAIGTVDNAHSGETIQVELRYPYPRETYDDDRTFYGEISNHMESGARPADIHSTLSEISDPNFEIRQKTGYLTKRGDRIKSWKSRWFVIQKNWLRYYSDKDSARPKGIVDLSKALDCKEDDSFSNGFTLTVPKRIYYIQAASADERASWMEMVLWKLDYYNPYRDGVETPKPLYTS